MGTTGKMISDFPELVAQWHPTKNAPHTPDSLTAGTSKQLWWRCTSGHEWTATGNARTNRLRDSGGVSQCKACVEVWPWPRVVEVATAITAQHGHLPPAAWFQKNKHGSLVTALYRHKKTWSDLQTAVGSFNESSVPSRSGIRWRSHPEASLSNFLFARGVNHARGRKYPEEYADVSDYSYGYYDLTFTDCCERTIDVEVWGDKPMGHDESRYARKRAAKEKFNAGRETFLGIHYLDCFSDRKLGNILRPFIGEVAPFQFTKPHDEHIETSHWSNADELLIACQKIADEQPDGKFPPEDWLRKRGRWADRPGASYNTISKYVATWIGGVRKVRQLLGQQHHSTEQWTRDRALAALKAWHDQYGRSPGAVRADYQRAKIVLPLDEYHRGSRILAAVEKYAGGVVEASRTLGLPVRASPGEGRAPQRSRARVGP